MLGVVIVRVAMALSPGANVMLDGFVVLVQLGGTVVVIVKMVGGNDGASLFRILTSYSAEKLLNPSSWGGEMVMLGGACSDGGAATSTGRERFAWRWG